MKPYRVPLAFLALSAILMIGGSRFVSRYQVGLSPGGMVVDAKTESGYTCPKHGTPLTSRPGYIARGSIVQGTNEFQELAGDFPGAIPLNGSLSKSEIHRTRALLTFCERCETGIERHFSKASSGEPHTAEPTANQAALE